MTFKDLEVGTPINFARKIWYKIDDHRIFHDLENNNGALRFDSPQNRNATERRIPYGSSFYKTSNIHQWLNSQDESWFSPQTSSDAVDMHFSQLSGFLSSFSQEEIACMKPMTYTCIVPNADRKQQHHGKIEMTSLITIPSLSQLTPLNNSSRLSDSKIKTLNIEGQINQFLYCYYNHKESRDVNYHNYYFQHNCMTRTADDSCSIYAICNDRWGSNYCSKIRCSRSTPFIPVIASIKDDVNVITSDLTMTYPEQSVNFNRVWSDQQLNPTNKNIMIIVPPENVTLNNPLFEQYLSIANL